MNALLFALLLLAHAHAQFPPGDEAIGLVNQGRFDEAIVKFQEAIKQDPKNSSLHLSLGLAYQSLRRYSEAIGAVEKAAKLAPKAPEPLYSLALLYEAVDELHKARRTWEKYQKIEKDPTKLNSARAHLEKLAALLK